jgi:hypothetical protein
MRRRAAGERVSKVTDLIFVLLIVDRIAGKY